MKSLYSKIPKDLTTGIFIWSLCFKIVASCLSSTWHMQSQMPLPTLIATWTGFPWIWKLNYRSLPPCIKVLLITYYRLALQRTAGNTLLPSIRAKGAVISYISCKASTERCSQIPNLWSCRSINLSKPTRTSRPSGVELQTTSHLLILSWWPYRNHYQCSRQSYSTKMMTLSCLTSLLHKS